MRARIISQSNEEPGEAAMWEAAVNVEYLSLTSKSTWELVPYSRDMKVIGSMWKFKFKRDSKRHINK